MVEEFEISAKKPLLFEVFRTIFFKVSKSAEGAPPILVLSALDCFLVSEVRSFSLDTTASVRFDKF